MSPLLFLDVDGPLIPFGGTHREYPVRRHRGGNPLLARINPGLGSRLLALPCELVWATTWMEDANEYVSPILGLPALPVMNWPDEDENPGLHWKTRPLVDRAAGRPFVWIDDELGEADRSWVAARHPGRALLLHVDARTGLVPGDLDTVSLWLNEFTL